RYIVVDPSVGGPSGLQLRLIDGSTPNFTPAGSTGTEIGRLYMVDPGATRGGTYVVTSVGPNGIESLASNELSHLLDLSSPGAYYEFSWAAVSGATRYRVYKKRGSIFGFVGQVEDTTFRDSGDLTPDISAQPPLRDTSIAL